MTAALSPEGRVAAAVRSPTRLLVLYDPRCPLCVRCRHWLEGQPTHLAIDFEAADSPEAIRRFREPLPWLGAELVVIGDRGEVWIGPAAFLVCLWATKEYREWSYRLAGPAFAPFAERFFHAVSTRRRSIARVLGAVDCPPGQCKHRK